jgi:hypothetical protein
MMDWPDCECRLMDRRSIQARAVFARRVPHEPTQSQVLDKDLVSCLLLA